MFSEKEIDELLLLIQKVYGKKVSRDVAVKVGEVFIALLRSVYI